MKEKKLYNASETHVSLENLQRFKNKNDERYSPKSHDHNIATTEANGYMSAGDKNKLDNLNNYIHPNDTNTRHVSDNEKGSILQYRGAVNTSTDFNLLVSNGMYQAQDLVIEQFVGATGSFYGWGQFTVRSTNVAIEQTYTAHQLGIILRRHSWDGGGTWGVWDYVYTSQNKPTPAEIGALGNNSRQVISTNSGGTSWSDAQLELNSGGDGSVSLSLHRPGYSHVAFIHDAANSLKVNMSNGTHTMWHSGNYDPNRVMYRDRNNHGDGATHGAVVGQLAWRAHGNGHTIFDASAGVSPDGGAVDPNNSQISWAGSYPTLMGWNGNNTYGVRVDTARYSDTTWRSSRVQGDSGGGSHVSWRDRDTIVQVDCPHSGGAASNVWKATRWGAHHIAACDVYDEMIRWIMHTDQVMSFNKYGDFVSSGNIIAYSDIKLKKDLEIIPDSINKIKALNGYTYTRKDTGLKQTGVVAQEVEKVLPEAIIKNAGVNGEETLGVAYGNMVGLLIEGIKDQQNQIEELKNIVKTLQMQI